MALPYASSTGDALLERWHRMQHRALHWMLAPFSSAWHVAMTGGRYLPGRAPMRAFRRELDAMLARDFDNARRGLYPRRLLLESGILQHARSLPDVIVDLPRILRRRFRKNWRELPERASGQTYPRYWLRTFHWQSDGWLSASSARKYDLGVELLFAGTAAVMRRMAIPPMTRELRDRPCPRVLDVGCGTGQFLTQVHAALPHARLYGLDLSPFYVQRARQVLAEVVDASLVADDAEHMPFGDGLFDAVTSVFLFHELPAKTRRRVLREMARVLRPGGLLVICDSFQVEDARRTRLQEYAEWFPRIYHEPYYPSYVRDDLGELMRSCGFTVEESASHLVSKVVVGRKRRPRGRSRLVRR